MIVWFILITLIALYAFLWVRGCPCNKGEPVQDKLVMEGFQQKSIGKVRIGVVSMIKHPTDHEEWFAHHRNMGISRFFVRLEESPEVEDWFRAQPDVDLTVGRSTGKNEYKEIQNRQQQMVNAALAKALQEGSVDWLIHIDADELLEGSLDEIRGLPASVRSCWMDNEEAVYDGIPAAGSTCFQAARFRNCQKPLQGDLGCASYANGKGAGRVAPDVKFGGPHRFRSGDDYGQKLRGVKVRHFESCQYDAFRAKFENLARNNTVDNIPFSYYNESIEAAKTGDDAVLECVFTKYRTVEGNPKDNCFSKA
jgi:hypothetical protein